MPTHSSPNMPVNFGTYQSLIYERGARGVKAPVTMDPRLFEQQAKKVLSPEAFGYLSGGAGERATMDSNRLAFRQWKLIPRVNKSMDNQCLSINLFGREYKSPILTAPVGVQGIFYPDSEPGVAEACSDIGVPFSLSTASCASIEVVAAASGNGCRWFMLYCLRDQDITLSLMNRAREHGFEVLVISLDIWTLGWRPIDLDNAYFPFTSGAGSDIGLSDRCFRAKYEQETGMKVEDDIPKAAKAWNAKLDGRPHTWEQIDFVRKHWKGPIVIKGIQHVDDARRAAESGCDGLIVSNHGGRQVDGAIGSLEVLPDIVDAVGDKMTVMFDSGIRTGADVIKALCLGAKAVFVGRPLGYGLALGGKEGVKAVLQGLLADVWQTMALMGISTVDECSRDKMKRVTYPGDLKAML